MQTAGIKEFINGPESFTPDGNFILGEAPEVRGVFVGAGFNAFGIASGGGAGMALAEWVAKVNCPTISGPSTSAASARPISTRTGCAPARSRPTPSTTPWLGRSRYPPAVRSAALRSTTGSRRRAPASARSLGWERPNWFADLAAGEKPEDHYSYEPRRTGSMPSAASTRQPRERVAVFDQTSFAKFLLVGRDAEKALSWIAANDVAKPPGHLVYTQMLNRRGGIECDLTIGRLSPDEYYIVTGTGFATHDYDWISRSIPDGLDARLIDVTSSYAVLSALMGPKSRDVLQQLTEHDMSNAGFPFARVKRITVAGAPVLALRVTYVGELGWELHIPVEFALPSTTR